MYKIMLVLVGYIFIGLIYTLYIEHIIHYTNIHEINIDDHWNTNTTPIIIVNLIAGVVFYPVLVAMDIINTAIYGIEED